MNLKDLEESVAFISAKFDEYEKHKKVKEEKICLLDNNLTDATGKIFSLEQKIYKQEQYSLQNCVLVHGLP